MSAAPVAEPVAAPAAMPVVDELQIPDLSDELDIDWGSMAEPATLVEPVPQPDSEHRQPILDEDVKETAAAAADEAPPSAPVDIPPALPGGLSISLDSLPAGVLGGGVGRLEEETPSASELLARAQALVAATPGGLDEVLRAAEQTLAEQTVVEQDALLSSLPPAVAPEAKSFTSLSEAELLEAMATLPGMQPAGLMEQDWPGLGETMQPDAALSAEQTEADILAASPLLQDESADEYANAVPSQAAVLPVLASDDVLSVEMEESWPGLGDVDRANETELSLPDEPEITPPVVSHPDALRQDLPVLDAEAHFTPANEAEDVIASASEMAPVAAQTVTTPVAALFAESPFASERAPEITPLAAEPALPSSSQPLAVPDAAPDLPVLTDIEPESAVATTQLPTPDSPPAAQPAALETLAGASFAAAMPQTGSQAVLPDGGKAVEVLNVAAVTTASASAALMNPAGHKDETVAVVDERALVEAMYEKLLPRMKVELSLWLQDALELQAKNMLSGVMQQLKEDYDMLFGETLKESLRQAILALGREQQGKAAQDKEQD